MILGGSGSPPVVALWEPDIKPPHHWLLPSILYQDKISTFAPMSDVSTRDGRESRELGEMLGPLYQPLSLMEALHPSESWALLDTLRARIPFWHRQAEQLYLRTENSLVHSWLDRSCGWHGRRHALKSSIQQTRVAEKNARRQVEQMREKVHLLDLQIASLSDEIAAMYSVIRVDIEKAKIDRRAAYIETLERRAALISKKGRWGRDPERDNEIRAVDIELKVIQQQVKSPDFPKRAAYDDLRSRLAIALESRRGESKELQILTGRLREESARLERQIRAERTPWTGDAVLQPWLSPYALDRQVPPFLDTIGPGKVHGEVFEFLATEAGMWVSQVGSVPYAGTLVGPRLVVEDVLSLLAEWYCASHTGWVSMSAAAYSPEDIVREFRSSEELISLSLHWLLPAPSNATLSEACEFRLAHEEELRAVRSALASALPNLSTIEELREVVNSMSIAISEPLNEIKRALELERTFKLRNTIQTVLYKSGSGLRNLGAGVAAGGVMAPIIGNTIGLDGIEASVGGGMMLTTAGLFYRYARSAVRLRSSRSSLENSPYKYLYEVGKRFGFAEE